MERHLFSKLHKIFFVVAIFNLLSGVALVAMEIYDFVMGKTSDLSSFRFFPKNNFNFLSDSISIFSITATTFCAFLVGEIFQLLAKKELSYLERATKFKNVCCLAYLLQGVFVLMHFIDGLPISLAGACMRFECGNDLLTLANYFGLIFKFLIDLSPPFLLAISIHVLFNHYANLLTFESEVA